MNYELKIMNELLIINNKSQTIKNRLANHTVVKHS